jgi:hypothetical protein
MEGSGGAHNCSALDSFTTIPHFLAPLFSHMAKDCSTALLQVGGLVGSTG